MKSEFIYNIKNIFSDEVGSVFYSTRTKMFYILLFAAGTKLEQQYRKSVDFKGLFLWKSVYL